MRPFIRSVAAMTVLAGVLAAPFFSRRASAQDPVAGASRESAASPVVALPAGWEGKLQRHLQREVPMEVSDLRALLRHAEESAERFDLDPFTVLAVIQVESGFDPYAVSPAGAMGLMQIRSETARELAERLGISWTSDEMLFDPEVNILLGTCYLRELLDRFGDLDVALAAFHAGPGRIEARNRRLGVSSRGYRDRVWNVLIRLYDTARV